MRKVVPKMSHTVTTGDVERRGLRLLVRLLSDPERPPDLSAVSNWIKEAASTLQSSGLVVSSLKEEVKALPPLVDDEDWKQLARDQMLFLTDYLHELGDLEVQLTGGRVFVSYVREDSLVVDRLAGDLRCFGIEVWLDRTDLGQAAGRDWSAVIRSVIEDGSCFIACFSENWSRRQSTYANEEVEVALGVMRTSTSAERWFLPVELTPQSIPELAIGQGRRVADLQSVQLYENWNRGVLEIADAILPPSGNLLLRRQSLFDPDPRVREDGARALYFRSDPRQMIPLIYMCQQQFALLDADPDPVVPAGHYAIEQALFEATRALGKLGQIDEWHSDRVLPVLIETLLRDFQWSDRLEDVMAQQRGTRALRIARALRNAKPFQLSDLVGEDDALSIDLDELDRRADELHAKVARLRRN